MIPRLLSFLIIIASAITATADNTTRRGKLNVRPELTRRQPQASEPDTLTLLPDNVTASGYDKTLRSRRESMFLTNNTGVTLIGVELKLEYFDMEARELHQRTVIVDCHLQPGATRRIDFPSWDKQFTFFYEKGPAPRTPNTTPFRVRVTALRGITASR